MIERNRVGLPFESAPQPRKANMVLRACFKFASRTAQLTEQQSMGLRGLTVIAVRRVRAISRGLAALSEARSLAGGSET